MHNEGDIRQAVGILVAKYGSLTTSEVKAKMPEVMVYDDEDKKKSEARHGEMMIVQRIGNIVSHQKVKTKIYEEGFSLVKHGNGAIFTAITGVGSETKEISTDEIGRRKRRSGNVNKTNPRKVDWDSVNERRTVIGRAGEDFVYNEEVKRIQDIDSKLIDRVQHLSEQLGDGAGFDIQSVDENGNPIFIEVKTTEKDEKTPFYMSVNEYGFFKSKKDENSAFLYRVYNFNVNSKRGDIEKIPAKELIEKYHPEPISFKMEKK